MILAAALLLQAAAATADPCAGRLLSHTLDPVVAVTGEAGGKLGELRGKTRPGSLNLVAKGCRGADYVIDFEGRRGLVSRLSVMPVKIAVAPCSPIDRGGALHSPSAMGAGAGMKC